MILTKLTIANFLSVKGPVVIDVDPKVTVLLGANDHGKTNILQALRCLNHDLPISSSQRNWDSKEPPSLEFILAISPEEYSEITQEIEKHLEICEEKLATQAAKSATADSDVDEDDAKEVVVPQGPKPISPSAPQAVQPRAVPETEDEEEDDDGAIDTTIDWAAQRGILSELRKGIVKSQAALVIRRDGVEEGLRVASVALSDLHKEMAEFLQRKIPRVEIFNPTSSSIQDSTRQHEIQTEEFEFMQGIFYSAGLDPLNSDSLFQQNEETERTLDEASIRLESHLRELWGQGAELGIKFELRHKGDSVELYANDPSVKRRKTRMSARSVGVTQFFRLSMILHARRKKQPANSYVYLFDEPGIFLHPKGQKDLLQVFEELSEEAQIIYATHSLFLLNQNFVERHRLVIRDHGGTKVDQKPYRNNWGLAIDEMLGADTANILFAPCVILTEGDSDRFYLVELFRHFNSGGKLDADLNHLAIYSYDDAPNLRYLIQKLQQRESCRVLALFEGDDQGARYLRGIENLAKGRKDLRCLRLGESLAIEDYCLFEELFLDVALQTLIEARKSEQQTKSGSDKKAKEIPTDEPKADVLRDAFTSKGSTNSGEWFKQQAEKFVGSREAASKVVLARTYAQRAREHGATVPNKSAEQRALKLCSDLKEALEIPSIRASRTIEAVGA